MAVELRHLRSLLAVVEEGTFTDAAIALRTSQASVSRAVADLEGELGARLFQRTSRGAVPTVAGVRVAAHARRVVDEVDAMARVADVTQAEVRVGYAWSALGRHTTALQRRWSGEHPGSALVFVQAGTSTAGLLEGAADIVVTRRPLDQRRFRCVPVGVETRYAAVAADDPLARRRSLRMSDFAGSTVAIDARTGTTTEELWPPDAAPATTRDTHNVDEWLTLIAARQAMGLTSAATTFQHPRPGIAYRLVRDAEPVPVWLGWWRDDEPSCASQLVQMATELYAESD
ncbi:LysR family transcriptional regulator [Cellulomonas aerilata]|uniref:LysR family transcriptional regulator n=1 Tax=Cellulomonas aerilata TaxID=515326 RepID=A0A512DAV5_9CELL|nr:LysR family transcriptional regulator [Cellulomonas aerilata]GEO33517.1 LysR family transcriptional regulator [Cellulomonas aerilata]